MGPIGTAAGGGTNGATRESASGADLSASQALKRGKLYGTALEQLQARLEELGLPTLGTDGLPMPGDGYPFAGGERFGSRRLPFGNAPAADGLPMPDDRYPFAGGERLDQLQIELIEEIEDFRAANDGKAPTSQDITSIINELLPQEVPAQESQEALAPEALAPEGQESQEGDLSVATSMFGPAAIAAPAAGPVAGLGGTGAMAGLGKGAALGGGALGSIAALASGLLLLGTSETGEEINQTHKLINGGTLTIKGRGEELERTLTLTDPSGETASLIASYAGEADGAPLFALQSGSLNGRSLSANDLRDLSTSLTSQGINAVYQESVDGEEEEDSLSGIGHNSGPAGVGAMDPGDVEEGEEETEKEPPVVLGDNWDYIRAAKMDWTAVTDVSYDHKPPEDPKVYLDAAFNLDGGNDLPDPAHGKGMRTGGRANYKGRMNAAQKRAVDRENQVADILAHHGFVVVQLREKPGQKNPDYEMYGKVWDCVAPSTGNLPTIWTRIIEKLSNIRKGKQTDRIILYLGDSKATNKQVLEQYYKYEKAKIEDKGLSLKGFIIIR